MANTACLVIHEDGICPGPYGKCTCDEITITPSPRIDWCDACKKDHGYDCPLDLEKTYPLLKNAPDHDSPEFIDYLRNNNPVVFENPQWIVIENCKYHKEENPWYTAFHKKGRSYWWQDIDILWFEFGDDWEWLKKHPKRKSVKRFHIHLYKP